MPESLWAAAAELAKRYGVNPTARALRLEYGGLRKESGEQILVAVGNPDTQRRSYVALAHKLNRDAVERLQDFRPR